MAQQAALPTVLLTQQRAEAHTVAAVVDRMGPAENVGSWKCQEGGEMLTNATQLKGFVIRATDGEIGAVDQFYFDDATWAIRYLTVKTGGWLGGRVVLISPLSITETNWQEKCLNVALTKSQVKNSPDLDTYRPVPRQDEAQYLNYYGYPYYWGFPQASVVVPSPRGLELLTDKIQQESTDTHLRSTEAVTGYGIEAADGEIGHVEGFVLDDESWAIRYMEVATRNWWPGKKVLVSPFVDSASKLDRLYGLCWAISRSYSNGARVR
jgi:hypothetical protein